MNRRGFLASLAALAAAPMVSQPVPAFSAGGIVRRPTLALIDEFHAHKSHIYLDGQLVGRVEVQAKEVERSFARASETMRKFEANFKACQP